MEIRSELTIMVLTVVFILPQTRARPKAALPIVSPKALSNSSGCFTIPFQLPLTRKKGCTNHRVRNNICLGSCKSVYILQPDKRLSGADLKVCMVCQPTEKVRVKRLRKCEGEDKKIMLIEEEYDYVKSCGCLAGKC